MRDVRQPGEQTAGTNRVLTVALHSPQVHGFFSVPVDHLHALGELAEYFQRTTPPTPWSSLGR